MKLSPSKTENKELVDIFNTIADALEFKGENPFRINAYRKAARAIEELDRDITEMADLAELKQVEGIGTGIAKKILEYIETGQIKKYKEATKGIPVSLLELLGVQNIGPKTLALAHKKLKVRNIEDLIRVIENGQLAGLPQMGEKKVKNIKKGIEIYKTAQERMSLSEATQTADQIITFLRKNASVKKISVAGSLRRWRETVGDIDILAAGSNGEKVISKFTSMPAVKRVLAHGSTKASIILNNDRQVDLRIVSEKNYGAALQYFTGSKAHNIKLRDIAKNQGMKLNEYGLFKGKRKIAGKEEHEIYTKLGLQYIPAEMREDRGEIELARKKEIPPLIQAKDIRGDLHVHTNYSDGDSSIEQMARYAMKLNYHFLLIADHSKSAKYANGLGEEKLMKQVEEIENLNKKLKDFKILKGIEVDILKNGTLDLADKILKRLDLVVGAIHSGFKKKVTERMLDAMDNPYLDIIAHPTGRLISKREGYHVDINRVMEKAAEKGVALELNSYYDRLDLSDVNLLRAKDFGIKISLGTDAHSPEGMSMIKFGIGIGRRAWLTKDDMINCLAIKKLLSWRRR